MTSDNGQGFSTGRELGQKFSTTVNGDAFLDPGGYLRTRLGNGARSDHAIRFARGHGFAQNLDPFTQEAGTERLGKTVVIGLDLYARSLEIQGKRSHPHASGTQQKHSLGVFHPTILRTPPGTESR